MPRNVFASRTVTKICFGVGEDVLPPFTACVPRAVRGPPDAQVIDAAVGIALVGIEIAQEGYVAGKPPLDAVEDHVAVSALGDFETSVGDFDTSVGDFDTSVADFDTSVGDFDTSVGFREPLPSVRLTSMGVPAASVGAVATCLGVGGEAAGVKPMQATSRPPRAKQERTRPLSSTRAGRDTPRTAAACTLDLVLEGGRIRFHAGTAALLEADELIGRLSTMVDSLVAEKEALEQRASSAEERATSAEERAERLAARLRELGEDPDV
ncbi:MAG: hypothetical protein JW940_37335 [Polyangiaceae bacterium]|nr:hypothetical protein [Polyangiaceae bacterium]